MLLLLLLLGRKHTTMSSCGDSTALSPGTLWSNPDNDDEGRCCRQTQSKLRKTLAPWLEGDQLGPISMQITHIHTVLSLPQQPRSSSIAIMQHIHTHTVFLLLLLLLCLCISLSSCSLASEPSLTAP